MARHGPRVRVRRHDGDVSGRGEVGGGSCREQYEVVGGGVGRRCDTDGVGVIGSQDLVIENWVATVSLISGSDLKLCIHRGGVLSYPTNRSQCEVAGAFVAWAEAKDRRPLSAAAMTMGLGTMAAVGL